MKEIAVRFLGNLTLATIVTAGRIPLMSIDHIINKGIELHYLTMPLLMSFVTTSAIFTWSEHLAMIDEEATPLTKFIFRRINEVRYIVIATFAATAALLNPSQHGVTFWITIAGVGLAGATIYFKASVISEWLEKQAWLKPLKNYLTSKQLSTVIRCQNLFVL